MEDERDSADIPRSTGSDPSGSRGRFKLSTKLRTRMEKLKKWGISPSSIKAPKDACQFHGGHATVSKGFLVNNFHVSDDDSDLKPRQVLRLCRESDGAVYHWRDAEVGLDDEEKDDEQEYGFDRDSRWRGEFVAVKKSRIGDNKDLERVLGLALREAEILVELNYENIVKIKGFVEDLTQDVIWLVFPWADNGNLKDFVASHDWEIPERLSLIADVAFGLTYLHRQKPPICHGDLKSFNVLVNSEHGAVITDFGSARRLTEHDLNRQPGPLQTQQQPLQATFSTLSKTITLTGNIYTLRWAAPELLNNDQMSLWSDIWALGWITYEVLTNSIPFQDVLADTVVVERVIKGDLSSANEHARVILFENICSLMNMCWNSNPSERPTARDYLQVIGDMPMAIPDGRYLGISGATPSSVLMIRGRRAQKSGDPVMALACFTEAYRIYTKNGDGKGKVNALNCLAELHLNQKEYGEANKLYSEVLQIHTDIGDGRGQASALSSLAEVQLHLEKYSEALKLYSEALQIRPGIDDSLGKASALSGLAQVHRLRKNYSKAIKLYSKALQIRTYIDNSRGRFLALSSFAQAHRLRNEYSEAIKLYSKALQI